MTRMSPSSKRIPAFRAEPAMRFERSSPRRISGNRGMRNSRKPEAAAEVSFEEEADSEGLAMSAEKEILREPGKAFTCREVSREKRTGGALELGKRAARDNSPEPLSPFSGAVCRLFPCPSVYPTACLLDVPAVSVAVLVVFARSAGAPDLVSDGGVPDPAELSAAPGLAFARSAAAPGPVSDGAARIPVDASVRAAGSHFQAHCQDCLAAPKADGRCRFSDCRHSRANCPACCQVC